MLINEYIFIGRIMELKRMLDIKTIYFNSITSLETTTETKIAWEKKNEKLLLQHV